MHSNFIDLKTKTMEYKELVNFHTQLIKDQNQNKWEVIETSDLEEICEAYHQAKLKLLGIGGVVGRSEQLPDANKRQCNCGNAKDKLNCGFECYNK